LVARPRRQKQKNDENSKSFGFINNRTFYKNTRDRNTSSYSSSHDFGMRPNSDTIPSLQEDRSDPHALWAKMFVGGGEVIG
jgi:hypothetical protein